MSSIGVPNGEQIERKEVLDLAVAQRLDAGSSVGPFHAAIPAQVVVGAVAVVLAVGLVVLVVVRDQIVQREPVMAGDEVDALFRPRAPRARRVGAAQEPRRHARPMPLSPFRKRRTSSRNRPFHSCQLSPTKLPT